MQYSLLYRAPEKNGVKQACEEGGTSLIAYSPLAQGLLTGALSHNMSSAHQKTFDVQWDNAWVFVCVHVSVFLSVCLSARAESGALKHDDFSLLVCSIDVDTLLFRLSSVASGSVLVRPKQRLLLRVY